MKFGSDSAAAWVFLSPSLIGFAVFYLVPFGMALLESLLNRTPEIAYAGLDHYRGLLDSASFRKAAANSLYFTAVSVPVLIGLSLALAMLVNGSVFARRWLQTSIVLPLVVPVASVVTFWRVMTDWDGGLNGWLDKEGVNRIDWMNSEWSMAVIAAIFIWKNLGYMMILFLAALQGIPRSYYETARIEGAGELRAFARITIVYLRPTMLFVVLISIINSFKVFRETYLIAGDYPYDRMYLLQHYMNNTFMSLDLPKLSAASVLMVGCIAMLVSGLLARERRFQRDME